MFADQALRCECGYEVRTSDEAARVEEVRRHASATHGIDLSADVALDVVRRATARAEQQPLSQSNRDGRRRTTPSGEE
jgi:predicted small metal-binding protein